LTASLTVHKQLQKQQQQLKVCGTCHTWLHATHWYILGVYVYVTHP